MRVDADLGVGVEDVAVGADPVADAVHHQPAAGVGDVDAVRAVGLHQLRLLRRARPASAMWLIIRNPETSMPSSRAVAMCWAETSASVQWVATRTDRTPSAWACLSSSMVPMPGSSSVVRRAFG